MQPAALPLTLALACLGVGCGGAGAGAKEKSEVTLTVTSRGYADERLLREIYAQALEATGFEVKRREVEPENPSDALENGRVSGYPDFLDTALAVITPLKLEEVPGRVDVAYSKARKEFATKGLVAFQPTSFVRTNWVGVSRKTAEERGLKAISDLKGPSHEMAVVGEFYCHLRVDCLGGLEDEYGIAFERFSVIRSPSRRLKALRTGETDAAMLTTTEGRLAGKKPWLVMLEDDQHRLPAANASWVTREDVVEEAGPDYEKTILAAQKGLTLEVIRELNAQLELQGKPPARVAAEYLDSIDLKE